MASSAASCTNGVSGTWQDITPPDVAAVLAAQSLGTGGAAAGPSWGIATVVFDANGTGSVYSWAIVVDPDEPQTIYANDGYGALGVYKSIDGGQHFTQTFIGNLVGPGQGAGMPVTSLFIDGGFIGTIRLDPTNHLHISSCRPTTAARRRSPSSVCSNRSTARPPGQS